ncbi:porin [Sphingobium sp. YR657]|nr:carbohydrate porin [Sphingobium sp. YR657]SHM43918.1 porin [Sphingobium sp. YR657]
MKKQIILVATLLSSSPVATYAQTAVGSVNMTATSDVTSALAPVAAGPLDSVKQQPMLGNLAIRKSLAEKGIALDGRWVVEPAVNMRGYRGHGLNVVSSINVGASLDMGKLGGIDNGLVRIVMTDRLGDSTNSERTGAYIQNQAFYGQGKNVRFNELSWEQTFAQGHLSVKAGFYPMGNDFGKLPYTCNFTNNGNCGHPLGPVYSSGWRDDPTGQWGARIKWSDPSGWYVQVAAYDVNMLRNQAGHGFDFDFDGERGMFFPVEAGYSHGKTPSDDAGTYKVTAYYETSRVALQGGATRRKRGELAQYFRPPSKSGNPTPIRCAGFPSSASIPSLIRTPV